MPDQLRPEKKLDSSSLNAKTAALRLLSYRSRSETEMGLRLQDRFTKDVINQTISDLRDKGLLNDISFAREWREKRERFKPRGAAAIKQELRQLGVGSDIIQETLTDFDDSYNAYQVGSKYATKLSLENRLVFKRKLGGFLHRKGFHGEVLGLTVERIWHELLDSLDSQIHSDGQYD